MTLLCMRKETVEHLGMVRVLPCPLFLSLSFPIAPHYTVAAAFPSTPLDAAATASFAALGYKSAITSSMSPERIEGRGAADFAFDGDDADTAGSCTGVPGCSAGSTLPRLGWPFTSVVSASTCCEDDFELAAVDGPVSL